MADEYVTYAHARKVLQAAMNNLASKMVSEQVTEHIRKIKAALEPGTIISDATIINGITTLVPKPSSEYLELARAIAVLMDAELAANAHLIPPSAG